MKNLLLIAALALAAAPAMASKARLTALNKAAHLSDVQDVFGNASKLTNHGDWLTFEFGPQPTNAATSRTAPKAEGGFSRGMGEAKYGFYLGHQSTWVSETRSQAMTNVEDLATDNTMNLFYAMKGGDLAWGVGLEYSKTDKKSTVQKQSVMGLNGGITMGALAVGLTIGLENKYTSGASGDAGYIDFKGKSAFDLNGTYTMDTITYSFGYDMNGAKADTGAVPAETLDLVISRLSLGAENSMKADGADFFYGAKYMMDTVENKITGGTKTVTSKLPVYIGVEADAASWLVLRASVQQNVLLGTTKTETAGVGESDTIANDTVVAAGVGMKFGKLSLDGTFKSASGTAATGDISGNNFLANTALTYNF